MNRWGQWGTAVLLGLPVMAGTARAQEGALARVVPPTQTAPASVRDLATAIPLISWDRKTHRVLLAIAPEEVIWRRRRVAPAGSDTPVEGDAPEDEAATVPLEPPRPGYGLDAGFVARHFSRKLVALPTVTVFAPTTMYRLIQPVKPPNPFVSLSLEEALRRLEGTLTVDQWTKLASTEGIGRDELAPRQQPIFDAILPDDTMASYVSFNENDVPVLAPAVGLTEAQRRNTRISLTRAANFSILDRSGTPVSERSFRNTAPGTPQWEFTGHHDSSEMNFGTAVRSKMPNRLKPGDLDLKDPSLDVPVAVGGIKNVGELVAAVRAKTGLDIYVDGRLSRLSVLLSADDTPTIRAADILEALCWALEATYRKVGPANPGGSDFAYVLTYDREGLSLQRGRILWWYAQGFGIREVSKRESERAVIAGKGGQYLTFRPDALLNPTPEALAIVESQKDGNSSVPVSALTDVQRSQFQAGLAALRKKPKSPTDLQTERVGLYLSTRARFVVPGLGTVETDAELPEPPPEGDDDPVVKAKKKQIADSGPLPGGNVLLAVSAPRDAAEAEALMAAVRGRGLRQVWIQTTDSGGATLADCVAAGKAHQVPVGALISLMRSASGAIPRPQQAVNVFGETGSEFAARIGPLISLLDMDNDNASPILSPDDIPNPALPETFALLKRRVDAASATPGLAGLALREAVAPGFSAESSSNMDSMPGVPFGYRVEERLSFLRLHGYDPIDLDAEMEPTTSLPFFDTSGVGDIDRGREPPSDAVMAALVAWHAQLAKEQTDMLLRLRSAITTKSPALPLYLAPNGQGYVADEGGDAYQLWDMAKALPKASTGEDDLRLSPTIRKGYVATVVYRHARYARAFAADPDFATRITEPGMLAAVLHDFVVPGPKATHPLPTALLDLTSMPVSDAITLIQGAFVPAVAPTR